MQKILYTFSPIFILCTLLTACNQNKTSKDLNRWTGTYDFAETPITGENDFRMLMYWSLSVECKVDSCKGILEVDGHLTAIKWQTQITGDTNRIAVLFDRVIDGQDEGMKKGDTLFLLGKSKGKLKTTWAAMKPRLMENTPQECACFQRP